MGPEAVAGASFHAQASRAVVRLAPIRSPGERVAFAIFGAIATLMFFAGISMIAPAGSLLAYSSHDARAAGAVQFAIVFGLIFGVAGFVVRRLIRSLRPLLPNEREAHGPGEPVGGWLLVLAVGLAVLPFTTYAELAPLRALWSDALKLMREHGILDEAMKGGQLSGLVLLPIFMALFTPMLQMAACAMFGVGSAALLLLLWQRSARFPRGYVIALVLQGALVAGSVYATGLAERAARWVEAQAGTSASDMRTLEHVRILESVDRYVDVLNESSSALLLALAGYALWLPALLTSQRVRDTFAPVADGAAWPDNRPGTLARFGAQSSNAHARPQAMDPDARRRFYEEAARSLQERNHGVWLHPNALRVTLAPILIFVLLALFGAARVLNRLWALQPAG